MSEPDELYTLRAQFWLGHYALALEEARSVSRRPMSAALKAEREEYAARALIALGQYDRVTSTETGALQALSIKARYDASAGNEAVQQSCIDQLKSLLGTHATDASVQLTVSQVLFMAGQIKEALQAVSSGSHNTATTSVSMSLEQTLMQLQIYLKLDRLDLARNTALAQLRRLDEDSVMTQLGSVYVALASGSSMAGDAMHTLNSLVEQYGPSPYLLNLMACALMQQGDFEGAEQRLEECLRDFAGAGHAAIPDTFINLLVCTVQQGKPVDWNSNVAVQTLLKQYPSHAFCTHLNLVMSAFDREAVKYKA